MSDLKPTRHEHERGAPLIKDCDTWCEGKYKRWKEQNEALNELADQAQELDMGYNTSEDKQ